MDISGRVDDRPDFDPYKLLTIPQVVEHTQRGRSSIYKDIASGRLKSIKVGGLRRVRRGELERYIAEFDGK